MERHISILNDYKALWKIWRTFRKEKPTMVHSMTPKAGMLCMVAAWLAGVPVRVHTFTGLVFPTSTGLKRRILMFTDWLTCACATHIIPEGEGVMADLRNNGITKKPMRVLGYGNVRGVDMEYFVRSEKLQVISDKLRDDIVNLNLNDNEGRRTKDERRKTKDDNEEQLSIVNCQLSIKDVNPFTFLFVGRVVRDKGINELVEAFLRLHEEYAGTRLWLVGPYEDSLDPISNETRQAIAENDSIEAVGKKVEEELLAYYAVADCFVLPSYREGFPNTVLEAGAMGLPSIVTDINGSREIIQNGVNGMIVPPRDAESLYSAMRVMVQSKVDREFMAGNARKKIADRFEQGFVRKCLYEFYDEILQP
jgi:glycosyltransferase involved in cell wall biosynthesis